jgi:hypothetical protein
MSVFLRWGVFGILGVAALLYAYNASKKLAETHAGRPKVGAVEPASPRSEESAGPEESVAPTTPIEQRQPTAPAHCEAELVVARRTLELKAAGEPLDRVLRMQEIAWEEAPVRRARLEKVAMRWYGYEGSFKPGALRIAVISDCQQFAPAP